MHKSRGTRRGRIVSSAIAMTAFAFVLPAAARADTYLVQLKAKPLAAYTGGTGGIAGTSPAVTGRKLKVDSANGLDYDAYLAHRQSDALARAGVSSAHVVYRYRNAFAGFSAQLSSAQADKLKRDPDVAGVYQDTLQHITQDGADDPDALLGGPFGDGAAYLRLTDPVTGLWDQLGGPEAADGAGAGVIVGDIDTGIQPGHPSFSDTPDNGSYLGAPFSPPPVWDGACEAGEGFSVSDCNNKLIGARYYLDGFGESNLDPKSFISPRDDDGHGTNTASIAAGNYGVQPSIDGNDLGVAAISGIAPRAYLAAYKVCWNGNGTTRASGCDTSDIVKAIDQAVADGVDVINLSLGNTVSELFGPEESALLGASDAGVFVANSAGNNGPNAGTVGSPGSVPWVTTVGADSMHRAFTSTVTVTNTAGTFTVTGASVTNALPATPLVDAASAAASGVTSAAAALCQTGTLDPAKVAGKVVLCLRGTNDRINKSLNVQQAGGAGMILYNANAAQELDTDTHWVPTAHLTNADGLKVKAAIAAGNATASLTAGTADSNFKPRVLAAFSSRGPQTAAPDIIKPDLTAPGVQILAGAADEPAPASENRPGQLFATMQGTSQAAPFVAGAGALLTQAHPWLSAAEIKSELMETANSGVLEQDGVTPATPFDAGAGEINPNAAANSGLVLDTTTTDYIAYLEAVDPAAVIGTIAPKRPSDLNLPSISFSHFVGTDHTTRTFTSVDPTATRWTVSVQAPPGLTATVDTQFFTIKPGQTQALTVSLAQVNAPLNQYTYGALVLTDGTRVLRLPIAVKPFYATVPARILAATASASGSQALPVTPGYSGTLSALGWGLAAPSVQSAQKVTATSGNPNLSGNDAGTKLYPVTVPSGSQLLSTRLSNVDNGNPNADLDLYVYRDPNGDGNYSDAQLVGVSDQVGSAESVDLPFPAAGKYVIAVVGYQTLATGSVFDLTDWVVTDAAADDTTGGPGISVTGDPAAVTAGTPVSLTLNWAHVQPKGTYLGVVTYHQTATPTASNVSGFSIVELTKTADATTGSGGDGSGTDGGTGTGSGDTAATPEPAPAPAPAALTPAAQLGSLPVVTVTAPVAVRSAALAGRTLTLRVRATRSAALRAWIVRGSAFVARVSEHTVHSRAATQTLRLKLNHTLRAGRYTAKVIVTADGRESVQRFALRVRR